MPGPERQVLEYDLPEAVQVEIRLGGEVFLASKVGGTEFFDFMKLAVEATPADAGERMAQEAAHAVKLFGLLQEHMSAEEYRRFHGFCRERSVPVELLIQIVQDLARVSANRPTEPPSPSGPGRSPTGNGSTEAASLLGSMLEGSPSTAP